MRIAALELLAASFAVLFQELTLIRWLATEIRVIAYFPNLILMSTFLGLGIGCLLADARRLMWLWPASILVIAAMTRVLGGIVFTREAQTEYLWLLYFDMPRDAPVIGTITLPIVLCFVVCAVSFVPLGQYVAQRIDLFRRESSALWGYCWDIGGSLLGVCAFAVAGFSGAPPLAWFAVFLFVGLVFFRRSPRDCALYALLALTAAAVVGTTQRDWIYSPYYAIGTEPLAEGGFNLTVNGSVHQTPMNFDEAARTRFPLAGRAYGGYVKPYEWMGRTPEKILILGAGTGNDIDIALRQGVSQIDAVEIDPEILRIGRERHPGRPYDSERVRVHNTDARSFLNATTETYDLIVFATLDSLTRLSAMSNVRLDNFVYTTDAIELARRRLEPDGGLVMYFAVGTVAIEQRLFGILAETFGTAPYVHREDRTLFNRIFVTGPAFASVTDPLPDSLMAEHEQSGRILYEPPSDDWPFLYLEKRTIGSFYLRVIAIIALLALVSILAAMRIASPKGPHGSRSLTGFDAELFLFGMGFLLLETRAITAMSLLWGATWITSAVVFASVLLMILAATIASQLRAIPYRFGMAGLVLSLVASYFVPVGSLLSVDPFVKLAWSVVLIGLPVLFASLCFAAVFRERERPGVAFGWNVLGAVCGGLLEFASMLLGLKALLLLALVAYLLAFRVHERQRTAATA